MHAASCQVLALADGVHLEELVDVEELPAQCASFATPKGTDSWNAAAMSCMLLT